MKISMIALIAIITASNALAADVICGHGTGTGKFALQAAIDKATAQLNQILEISPSAPASAPVITILANGGVTSASVCVTVKL